MILVDYAGQVIYTKCIELTRKAKGFLETISERSMGILPMSITGVPPVQTPKNMAKMAMLLTGETPVLRFLR